MTVFLGLISDSNKASSLRKAARSYQASLEDKRVYELDPIVFRDVPGAPFSYWVTDTIRSIFKNNPQLEASGRDVQSGASTMNDFRFLRLWWETYGTLPLRAASGDPLDDKWVTLSKGGAFASFYIDWELKLNWQDDGREIKEHVAAYRGGKGWGYHWAAALNGYNQYFRAGLTWPRRSQKGLSVRVLPSRAIFGDKGPTIFVPDNDAEQLLTILAIANSSAFFELVRLQMAFGSYEVGVLERTPLPVDGLVSGSSLAVLAKRAWSLKRSLDTVEETSHAFVLPAALRTRLGDFDPPAMEQELTSIQAEIDAISFDLYGFTENDRALLEVTQRATASDGSEALNVEDDEAEVAGGALSIEQSAGLASWAVGVAFGRFDWRLATGDRTAPSEPDPFDPLPSKSPGMVADCAQRFHSHAGILVEDRGHQHDLPRLVEEVLAEVEAPLSLDIRAWLRRDFFPIHLQRYSGSRRKAPIYWPLSTRSGGYTLWIYYPDLTRQTIYTALNDFVEPKLKQVGQEVLVLRNEGSRRSGEGEKRLEALLALELELTEFRDILLHIAPTYHPHHDDGVQITAAPLWTAFRHKPWQKVLKDTWDKLEEGEYDWAHLAMSYWPDRVRGKCKADKSLAIAHGLEQLYVEPEAQPAKARGRKKDDAA